MLYLISGASRSGKTIIAKQLSVQMGIPYMSLDWIMMGFTNGIPEYGIHDKLFPDEIAERMWSFLKAMFESMIYVDTDCIIEGEALLPELTYELLKKYPNKIKICFVGYKDVSVQRKTNDIINFSTGNGDWLIDKSQDYIIDHTKNMISYSKRIESSCRKLNLKYFDSSANFQKTIDEVVNYLMLKV